MKLGEDIKHKDLTLYIELHVTGTNMIIQNKGKIHIQSESMWSLAMVQQLEHLTNRPSLANCTKHKDLTL